jgi:ABC-type nitrate/sulfonate/bicarbonate transport system permease component
VEATYRREVKNRAAFMEKTMPRWVPVLGILAVLAVWELICRNGLVSSLYLPSPSSVLLAGWEMVLTGELLNNVKASLYRIAVGFITGSAAGVLLGMMIGFSKLVEAIGNPIIYFIYPVPKIALLPLFILWLGIGELSKVTIISLGVFFPVVINTYSGVVNVDPLLIKAAVSFKATRFNVIRKVILPGALPVIFAGLKMASGTSLLLLVAAEMIAAKEGIGVMILHYGDLMLTTKLMVGVLTLSLLGVIFNKLLHWLEKWVIPWKIL